MQQRLGTELAPENVFDSERRYTQATLLVSDPVLVLTHLVLRLHELRSELIPYYGTRERASNHFHAFSRGKSGMERVMQEAFPAGEVVYFGEGYKGGPSRQGSSVNSNVMVMCAYEYPHLHPSDVTLVPWHCCCFCCCCWPCSATTGLFNLDAEI